MNTVIGNTTHEQLYPQTTDARIHYLRTEAARKAARRDQMRRIRRNPQGTEAQIWQRENQIAAMYEAEHAGSFYFGPNAINGKRAARDAEAEELRTEIRRLKAML